MPSSALSRAPSLEVEGISLDALYETGPTIYDPIPEVERSGLTYFRGVNLGKLASNILQDKYVLNAGGDNLISFGSYFRARWAAQNIVESCVGENIQFSLDDREFIENKTGLALPARMPAMIVALKPGVGPGPLVDIERYDYEAALCELETTSLSAISDLFTLTMQTSA